MATHPMPNAWEESVVPAQSVKGKIISNMKNQQRLVAIAVDFSC